MVISAPKSQKNKPQEAPPEAFTTPKTQLYDSFEDSLHLQNYVCIRSKGQECWAILNADGGQLQFVFEWQVQPYHETSISDDDIGHLIEVLASVRQNELNTVYSLISSDPAQDLKDLSQFSENLLPHKKALYTSKKYKLQDLALTKQFNRMQYVFSQTYTVFPTTVSARDGFEKAFLNIRKIWNTFVTQQAAKEEREEHRLVLKNVFDVWLDYCTKIEPTGLDPRPMSGQQMWERSWKRINGYNKPVPKLPHYFLYDLDTGFFEEVDSAGNQMHSGACAHVSTQLCHSKAPKAHPEYVYLPNRQCYVGACYFETLPEDFGEAEPQKKYKYLWDNLICKGISDVEFVSQISWVNVDANYRQLQNYTKENIQVQSKARTEGSLDKQAELITGEAEDAQQMLLKGDLPRYIGFALLVYAKDLDTLASKIRKIKSSIQEPARIEQEKDFAWQVWLQTFNLRTEPLYCGSGGLGLIPEDFRFKINISASIGLCQLVGIKSYPGIGIDFISKYGGIPINVSLEDENGEPRHGCILGKSGSGKSAMSNRIVIQSDALDWFTTIMDLPDKNGNSSYGRLVKYLNGLFIDTGTCSLNPLELIDVSGFSEDEGLSKLKDFYSTIHKFVQSLILSSLSAQELNSVPVAQVNTVLKNAVNAFYADEEIDVRFKAALQDGLGTSAWSQTPTLLEFDNFVNLKRLGMVNEQGKTDPADERAVSFIKGVLKTYFTDPKWYDCLCKPSTYDVRKHKLVLFSLKSVTDNDVSIFGLLATQAALRRSMGSGRSFFYIDEASVLLKYASLAEYVGVLFAVARKSGMSLLLALQDAAGILNCATKDQIINNLSYKLIGVTAKGEAVIESYRQIGIKREDILINSTQAFQPSKKAMYSNWLIDDGTHITRAKSYGYSLPLSLVVNGRLEVLAWEAVLEDTLQKGGDELEATFKFAALVEHCFEVGESLDLKYLDNAVNYCQRKVKERREKLKFEYGLVA